MEMKYPIEWTGPHSYFSWRGHMTLGRDCRPKRDTFLDRIASQECVDDGRETREENGILTPVASAWIVALNNRVLQ